MRDYSLCCVSKEIHVQAGQCRMLQALDCMSLPANANSGNTRRSKSPSVDLSEDKSVSAFLMLPSTSPRIASNCSVAIRILVELVIFGLFLKININIRIWVRKLHCSRGNKTNPDLAKV